jgi:hypothetical protein
MSPLMLAASLLGCGESMPAVPAGAEVVTIAHSARMDGDLEPCG